MVHPDSCAVFATTEFQTWFGKGLEQPDLTVKMALLGSGDWAKHSRGAGGSVTQRFPPPKLFHAYVTFHILGC